MRRVLVPVTILFLALLATLLPGRASASGDGRTVYIAQGEQFPDALVGGVLAASHNAPLLLVSGAKHRDEVPSSTAVALAELSPDRIVVFGGPEAVSAAVVRDLRAFASTVERVGGADRFETAALIARDVPQAVTNADHVDGLDADELLRGTVAAAAVVDEGGNVSVSRGSVSAGVVEEGVICLALADGIAADHATIQVTAHHDDSPALATWRVPADDDACTGSFEVTTYRYVEERNGKGRFERAPVAFSLAVWIS